VDPKDLARAQQALDQGADEIVVPAEFLREALEALTCAGRKPRYPVGTPVLVQGPDRRTVRALICNVWRGEALDQEPVYAVRTGAGSADVLLTESAIEPLKTRTGGTT
jgi:hypothetical protein